MMIVRGRPHVPASGGGGVVQLGRQDGGGCVSPAVCGLLGAGGLVVRWCGGGGAAVGGVGSGGTDLNSGFGGNLCV
jgi:hypothetical protein